MTQRRCYLGLCDVRGPDQAGESGAFRPITPSNLCLPELGLSEFGAPLLSPTSAAPSLGAENSREPYAEDLKRAERHFRRHGLLRSFKQTVIPAARGGLVNRAKHKQLWPPFQKNDKAVNHRGQRRQWRVPAWRKDDIIPAPEAGAAHPDEEVRQNLHPPPSYRRTAH
jgi:hypothetical protein